MSAFKLKKPVLILRDVAIANRAIPQLKDEFATSTVVKQCLELPENASVKAVCPSSTEFAEWVFSNECVAVLQNPNMLNVSVLKLIEMVLLTELERHAGVGIQIPSALGYDIPPAPSVVGSVQTVWRSLPERGLTPENHGVQLKLDPIQVPVKYHLFISAHCELSGDLASELEAAITGLQLASGSSDPRSANALTDALIESSQQALFIFTVASLRNPAFCRDVASALDLLELENVILAFLSPAAGGAL